MTQHFLESRCIGELYIIISSVVEFQRWWVLKSKIFGHESTYSKENNSKKSVDELWFVKKCQNRTFKFNFRCQKSTELFQKKISFKNINLGDHFLAKTFFSRLNFLTTLFFDGFLNRSMLILGQKPYFLGPTIFDIPQRIRLCKKIRLYNLKVLVLSVSIA